MEQRIINRCVGLHAQPRSAVNVAVSQPVTGGTLPPQPGGMFGMTGKEIRLNKLFSGGNAVVVAVDHGEFDGPIPGMVNLPEAVKNIDPSVDAVLLSPGMLPHCGHIFTAKGAPMAIVRLNWNSHFCFGWSYSEGFGVPAATAGDAAAAGADIVLACLTLRTGSESTDAANVEVFGKIVSEAKKIGLPVIGEYFPTGMHRLSEEELHDEILKGCRIAAELGADCIKTFYTCDFAKIVEACPVPILSLGVEKIPKQVQALELAEKIVRAGGKGVVFGRNAVQISDPAAFQRALCQVVKRSTPAAEAAAQQGLQD